MLSGYFSAKYFDRSPLFEYCIRSEYLASEFKRSDIGDANSESKFIPNLENVPRGTKSNNLDIEVCGRAINSEILRRESIVEEDTDSR